MSSDRYLPAKGSIIREMFLHTADENYIVARWTSENQLVTDFFWNSVHALEKYMKAVLLFNDRPVKNHGHGLAGLYEDVKKIGDGLLPDRLSQPEDLDIAYWLELSPEDFLSRLDDNGNADNRYLTFGHNRRPSDLHMVDAMVWHLRRMALPLDAPIVRRRDGASAPSRREILSRQPDYASDLGLPVDRLIHGPDSSMRRVLLNNNCAFAPEDFEHEPRRSGSSARNPVLMRRILTPLGSSNPKAAREGLRVAEWLLSNTRMPAAVRSQIEQAMRDALAVNPSLADDEP